jgi:hypothetical protein
MRAPGEIKEKPNSFMMQQNRICKFKVVLKKKLHVDNRCSYVCAKFET